MRWLAVFFGILFALSLVCASDIDVNVSVKPEVKTLATMLPLGALLLGILLPIPFVLFVKRYFEEIIEGGIDSFKSFAGVVFTFATFVLIVILFSYVVYYLVQPV